MHPNPIFRQTPEARNVAFARAQGFGVLAVVAEGAPLMSHIPFLLSEDGAVAEFHLVRSNPIARALAAPLHARLAVVGPHSYVSPDWYGVEDQVPTWNYVAVHLVGMSNCGRRTRCAICWTGSRRSWRISCCRRCRGKPKR